MSRFSKKFCAKSPFKHGQRDPAHMKGHAAAGDESDAAHGSDAFKNVIAETVAKQKQQEEKAESNPNKDRIASLRAELKTLDEFGSEADSKRADEIRAELKKLRK